MFLQTDVRRNPAIAQLLSSRKLTTGASLRLRREVLSSGILELDAFLPHGGFQVGEISEIVGSGGKHSIAACAMALHSQDGFAAYASPGGLINPRLLSLLGASMENCFFLVEPALPRLLWAVQQIVGSGLFKLVIFYASRWDTKVPILDPVSWRRLLGLSKKHRTALLLLLEEHVGLGAFARPCSLRLQVSSWQGEAGGIQIRVVKCAGSAPRDITLLINPLHRGYPEIANRARYGTSWTRSVR